MDPSLARSRSESSAPEENRLNPPAPAPSQPWSLPTYGGPPFPAASAAPAANNKRDLFPRNDVEPRGPRGNDLARTMSDSRALHAPAPTVPTSTLDIYSRKLHRRRARANSSWAPAGGPSAAKASSAKAVEQQRGGVGVGAPAAASNTTTDSIVRESVSRTSPSPAGLERTSPSPPNSTPPRERLPGGPRPARARRSGKKETSPNDQADNRSSKTPPSARHKRNSWGKPGLLSRVTHTLFDDEAAGESSAGSRASSRESVDRSSGSGEVNKATPTRRAGGKGWRMLSSFRKPEHADEKNQLSSAVVGRPSSAVGLGALSEDPRPGSPSDGLGAARSPGFPGEGSFFSLHGRSGLTPQPSKSTDEGVPPSGTSGRSGRGGARSEYFPPMSTNWSNYPPSAGTADSPTSDIGTARRGFAALERNPSGTNTQPRASRYSSDDDEDDSPLGVYVVTK